jgi:hypothetical protein
LLKMDSEKLEIYVINIIEVYTSKTLPQKGTRQKMA